MPEDLRLIEDYLPNEAMSAETPRSARGVRALSALTLSASTPFRPFSSLSLPVRLP